MSRQRVVPRLLALTGLLVIAASPAIALADIAVPEPAPQPEPAPPPEVKAEPAPQPEAKTEPETKKDDAKQDDAKQDEAKKDEAKKSGTCSMVDNDDRVIGLAGLVLLISGFALRRRRS